MLDIKFVRENPEKVKENIKKKFQDKKLGLVDEVIALDSEYSKSPETMQKFVDYASDENLDLKYLIKLATKKGKVTNPSNTDAYYYNQVLLGKNINEAVLFLKDDASENRNIKSALEREVKE